MRRDCNTALFVDSVSDPCSPCQIHPLHAEWQIIGQRLRNGIHLSTACIGIFVVIGVQTLAAEIRSDVDRVDIGIGHMNLLALKKRNAVRNVLQRIDGDQRPIDQMMVGDGKIVKACFAVGIGKRLRDARGKVGFGDDDDRLNAIELGN